MPRCPGRRRRGARSPRAARGGRPGPRTRRRRPRPPPPPAPAADLGVPPPPHQPGGGANPPVQRADADAGARRPPRAARRAPARRRRRARPPAAVRGCAARRPGAHPLRYAEPFPPHLCYTALQTEGVSPHIERGALASPSGARAFRTSRRGGFRVAQTMRLFLLVEAASFVAAALVHFGVLADDYRQRAAGTAESVIGAVLLAGLVLTLLRPAGTRSAP